MMSIRMRVHDSEPIGQALRRFKKLLERRGVWREIREHSNPQFVPATQHRRKKRFQKRLKAREATFRAQQSGEQPVASLEEASETFWKRTGKR